MTEQPRILIVEDDENVRTSLTAFLEANNYRVSEACDLVQARRLLDEVKFSAVILDRYVGAQLGTDLIGEIRAAHPETVVAIVSGDSSAVADADICVTKADPPRVLLDQLGRSIRRR